MLSLTIRSSTTVKVNRNFTRCMVVIGNYILFSAMKILSSIVLCSLLGSGLNCHFYRPSRDSIKPQHNFKIKLGSWVLCGTSVLILILRNQMVPVINLFCCVHFNCDNTVTLQNEHPQNLALDKGLIRSV